MADILRRHSGHSADLTPDYHKSNDDFVKFGFWVLIGIIVGLLTLTRILPQYVLSAYRFMAIRYNFYAVPEEQRPKQTGRIHARCIAWLRRIAYLRLSCGRRFVYYCDPPTSGELLFLVAYWAIISAALWVKVIFKSPIKAYGIQWEVVGLRAAWAGTMQFPLLYATGCKYSILSLLTGISVRRLNWFHQWIARTLFVVLGIHWTFFFQEWVLAGFVQQEIKMMPMVVWGFAAWTSIGLMVISGFRWFRDQAFEIWLVSHVGLAWAVLALSYTHTHCTTYFVLASVSCLIYDLAVRICLAIVYNSSWLRNLHGVIEYGHPLRIEVLNDDYSRLRIRCPNFSWKAGQYIYLTVPAIQPFQSHPFTIANARFAEHKTDDMVIIVKRHAGFTDQLHRVAAERTGSPLRCLLQGPHGKSPKLRDCDTCIFVSTGNRTSYCIALLQDLVQERDKPIKILFCIIFTDESIYKWYEDILRSCSEACKVSGSSIEVRVFVTKPTTRHTSLPDQDATGLLSDHFVVGRGSTESESSIDALDLSAEVAEEVKERSESETWSEKQSSDNTRSSESQTHLLAAKQNLHTLDLAYSNSHRTYGVIYQRPEADELLRDTILQSDPTDKVCVVAAVPSLLAKDLSDQVCKYIANTARAHHARDIRLWIEYNR